MKILRGDIVLADANVLEQGSKQGGVRPVVVISNNKANKYSPIITVIPLTTRIAKKNYLPTHVILPAISCIGLVKDSVALCEQITALDKKNIFENQGKVDEDFLEQIIEAILIQIGVEEM